MSLTKNIKFPPGLYYHKNFLNTEEKSQVLDYLMTLNPIWEDRYSLHNPPPKGDVQRQLLRPVYWLGNWQFACLNYYHPPLGIKHRCIQAENYPPILANILKKIHFLAAKNIKRSDFPKNWNLNTCLINFYGNKLIDGKWTDCGRVGDHKDFEPGPVASLSFGERAYFQFVKGKKQLNQNNIIFSQWLEDNSLQIFGGKQWKDDSFHRVQRVENKMKNHIGPQIDNFVTRRINFTFRYVPKDHIYQLKDLPKEKKEDILPYLNQLKIHSPYFEKLIPKQIN